jgi:hypothetical protein
MHVAGCALRTQDGEKLLTALYEETAGADYILLYEASPPFTNWSVRARVTPLGEVGNENCENKTARIAFASTPAITYTSSIALLLILVTAGMERLADGRLLMVFRDWSGSPHGQLAITVSSNDGRNWSTPVAMKGAKGSVDPHAVEPKLFLLSNGVLGALLPSHHACLNCWSESCTDCVHAPVCICCRRIFGSAELWSAGHLLVDA